MHDHFHYIAPGHCPHHRTRCFETMEEELEERKVILLLRFKEHKCRYFTFNFLLNA